MPRNSGPAQRDLMGAHGAGKGDADRSPGWRDHYDEIDWKREPEGFHKIWGDHPGFERVSPGRIRKSYGEPAKLPSAPTRDWRCGPDPDPVADVTNFVETNSF